LGEEGFGIYGGGVWAYFYAFLQQEQIHLVGLNPEKAPKYAQLPMVVYENVAQPLT